MPVICWGALGKSANDPTTIDEEISAYIAAHNADINAHGLNGYALYIHRDTSPLDHVDYSVTSDKITADQIVGKDFRTAPDVGDSVDGVLMNPAGIQMYQGGQQQVNIPVSGDPTFKGRLSVKQLFFLQTYVATWFDTVDQINVTNGIVNQGSQARMGRMQLGAYPTAASQANFWIRPGALDGEERIFLETTMVPNISSQLFTYFGLGEMLETTQDDYGLGFAFIKGSPYVHVHYEETFATYPIKGHFTAIPHLFRVEFDYDLQQAKWFVDGQLYAVRGGLDTIPGSGMLWNTNMRTINAANHRIALRYLAVGVLA